MIWAGRRNHPGANDPMVDDKAKLAARASKKNVEAFLQKVAAAPVQAPSGRRGRLIFALDATASREPTWDRACQIQGQMFEETAALGGLDVQMAFYRGFHEFKTTKWLNNSKALVRQMTGVFCLGGETQIEKVLHHTVAETKQEKVNALVFVGDCCEENVDRLCAIAGELGMLGVPAFVFQEGHDPVAMRVFKQITHLTRGAYCHFDSSSAKQLRDLLSAVAVYAAGGRRALEDFSKRAGKDVALLTQQIR